jgi:hypothetical protein
MTVGMVAELNTLKASFLDQILTTYCPPSPELWAKFLNLNYAQSKIPNPIPGYWRITIRPT